MSISALILTCNKNEDIAPFILEVSSLLKSSGIETVVSTESKNLFPSIKFVTFDEISFSRRIKIGLEYVDSEYVLLLLDDYYIFDNNLLDKSITWEKELKEFGFSILKVCKDGKIHKKTKRLSNGTKRFKSLNVYDVDFHPTIWRKEVLLQVLSTKETDNPWELEPYLVDYANKHNLVCGISAQKIIYDELIVGGKFFRKAFNKHCKNKYFGMRKKLSFFQESCFKVKRFFYHIIPRFVIVFLKKIKKKKGYSDIN